MVDLTKYMKKELELVKPSEILAFAQYSSKIPDITKFTVGEPDFNTPEHIKEAAIAGVKANHSHYAPSNGTLGLRKAAANFLKERYGLEYNPENEVIVTNGATEAIYTALTSVLNPGDKVVVPTPIFPLYIADALLVGAEPILVDTSKNGFKLSADMLKGVLDEHGDDVRVVVLNYPSNPTGVTYSQKELDELADVIRDKPIFALCDEIYSELCYDQEHASLAKSLREQAIVLNGVSKSHAMTGYRIGIMTAPAEITKELSKIHQFTITTTTAIAQDAAQEAFENGLNDSQEMKKEYQARRDYLYSNLTKLGFECAKPQGAFYIFAKNPAGLEQDDKKFIYDLAEKAKVAVTAGSFFGKGGEHYIRLSYATSMEEIKKGVARIAKYVEEESK